MYAIISVLVTGKYACIVVTLAEMLNLLAGVLSKLNTHWLRMDLASCGSKCTMSPMSTPWVP